MTEKGNQTREKMLRELSDTRRKVASLERVVSAERAQREASEMAQQAMLLREVDRMRDELLSDLAYELRTPLAAIKGYGSMMLEYDARLTNDQKRYSLQAIDQASDTLEALIGVLSSLPRTPGESEVICDHRMITSAAIRTVDEPAGNAAGTIGETTFFFSRLPYQ